MKPSVAVPAATSGGFGWLDIIAGLAALGLVAGTAAWLIASPFPRLQDLPEWMYQGHLLARLLRGDEEAAALVRFAPYLPPNALSQFILGGLNLLMPPLAAGRVFILGYLAAFLVVAMLLARAAAPGTRGLLLLVLVGTFVLSLGFWKGLINFQMGLFLFAGFVWLWTIKRWQGPWLLLGASILIYLSHAAIFAVFILYVLLGEVLRDPGRRVTLPRASMLVPLVPSLALLAWYTLANAGQFEPMRTGDELLADDTLGQFAAHKIYTRFVIFKIYTVMKLGPMRTFHPEEGLSFLSGHPSLYWFGVGLNGAFAGVLGIAIAAGLWQRSRRFGLRGPGMLPLALILCVAPALLLAPETMFNVSNLGERLMIPAVLAVLATVALPPVGLRALAVIVLCALPLTASYLVDPYLLVEKSLLPDKQLYFTARSNRFDRLYPLLAAPDGQPSLSIFFDTSVLLSPRRRVDPPRRRMDRVPQE